MVIMKILNRASKLEKSILCAVLVAVITMTATNYSVFAQQCSDIRQKVFRLHILANSDSAVDQALKLKVRDKILEASSTLFTSSGGKVEAETQARASLDAIRSIAQVEVNKEGYDYKVGAEIVNMYFTTRTYSNVTLPAGDYDALRITIGAAKGHNWWCVLFPPLCLPSASAQGQQKLDDVLGRNEAGIVTNGKNSVVIKFKVVEIYESARNRIVSFFSKPKDKKKK
jgi:stage II sporulation protein R